MKWARQGYKVALVGRTHAKLSACADKIAGEGGVAKAFVADCTKEEDVKAACDAIEGEFGAPIETAVYNAAGSAPWKKWDEVAAADLMSSLQGSAVGLFHVAQRVCPGMVSRGSGTLAITGATASLRGKPVTTCFAAGKAAQRSLAQSLARDLGPRGVHVYYVIVDGGVAPPPPEACPATKIAPEAIAQTYWDLHSQPKSCWTFEVDVRPNVETW